MGGVRDRLRTGLIIGELAIALVLLVGAGLLIRSSLALQRVHPGFDPHGVASARLTLPARGICRAARVLQTLEHIVEAARNIPGVDAAGMTSQVPLGAGRQRQRPAAGRQADRAREFHPARLRIVTPGYLETMRIRIYRDAGFRTATAAAGRRSMVISEALARAAYPGRSDWQAHLVLRSRGGRQDPTTRRS